MTNQRRVQCNGDGGQSWLVAAVTAAVSAGLFWVAVVRGRVWRDCLAGTGSPAPSSCEAAHVWATLAAFGFWLMTLALTVTGAVVGIGDGRHRRRFAAGRWICVGVVGLCAPWALLAYAVCYGLAWLVPAPRRDPAAQLRQGGWQQAVQVYAALAGGQHPQPVFAPDLPPGEPVYLDAPFRYARFYGMDVSYRPGGMIAVGSPGVVAGAAIGRLIGASIGYARAASLSARRWRGHRPARVVVTATATLCQVSGRWLRFDHDAVITYTVTAEPACVLTFPDAAPLRLVGPSAWCHAVLFACLGFGPAALQNAAFLHPVRQAAQRLPADTPTTVGGAPASW